MPNSSRSKDDYTMKFGHSTEYNKRKNSLKTTYTKCDGKANPKLYSEKSKLSISLDQQS